MSILLKKIKSGQTLLSDGAVGTMLMAKGIEPGGCLEKLNIEQPRAVEEVANEYFQAGSDIILTNTLGGSDLKLAQYNLEDKSEQINTNAVKIVRKIVGDKAFVVASVGPTGRLLEPYGDISPDEVYQSYTRQLTALHNEKVDAICVETMTDLEEAKLAVKASKAISPDTPVMATMTYDSTDRGFFTIMGNNIEQSVTELTDAGADIIGSNCGNGIVNMVEIAKEFSKFSLLPIIIQANAGLPKSENGKLIFSETPEFMTKHCKTLLDIGVSIIGGCCGTTPAHIAAFRKLIDKFQKR